MIFKPNKSKYKRAIGRNKKLSAEQYNSIYSDETLSPLQKYRALRGEYESSKKYNF